jgi:1-acyl-sn-glycerol-3-phosphate acyltransferase
MTLSQRLVILFFRCLTSILCRIDDAQLAAVPTRGPLIIVTNHVNILEVPLMYTRLQPREMSGFVAAYRWRSWWIRWLLDVTGAIALRRGEADLRAMRQALEWLAQGKIFILSPEGTRSGDGRLQRGLPGAVLLALHSGAPMLPLVFYGQERYKENLRRLRRTDFHIAVGTPFHLDAEGVKVTQQIRLQMIDEIMYRLAALLPEAYRGVYSDLSEATQQFIAP